MAANLLPFRPIGVRACATSGHRKPDSHRRKSSSSNWWTPLFGWSSEPDYIDSDNKTGTPAKADSKSEAESDPEMKSSRSRFAPGCFTEEKAKQLRMMTKETASFHDAMYHSAIASRLASDFKNRPDLVCNENVGSMHGENRWSCMQWIKDRTHPLSHWHILESD
ncbi:hypothetical protein F0562_030046 [Nyssa sinensis]|uniref:Uncharacterized protein n=1 Tax=Nyssa sinensis TaxID=561372 RepID=A0A5J5AVW4_9ASTE|nr:hypothetical protein F0562_030046 [Nyssa sinensis]